jgi:hypothetical protein
MDLLAQQNAHLRPRHLPSRIVCDKYSMFTSQLGDEIRITSIGELSQWNTVRTPRVDKEFRLEVSIRQFHRSNRGLKSQI